MRYEVWPNNREQWDPNDIDPPYAVINAGTPAQAAEEFASEGGDTSADVIVRDQHGAYFEVSVYSSWVTRSCRATTLEELSAP